MKVSPLWLSVILTIVEALLFIIIADSGVTEPGKSECHIPSLMQHLLPHVGNLIIAIATTWYVTFTYFIFKATEDVRKKTAEPFLLIKWSRNPEVNSEKFNYSENIQSELRKNFGSLFQQTSGLEGKNFPERFLNIEIQNERSATLGFTQIFIELSIIPKEESAIGISPIYLEWKMDRVGLGIGERILITVVDLTCIPDIFRVKTAIKRVSYSSSDSPSKLTGYNGDSEYLCEGMVSYQAVVQTPSQV